MNLKPGLFIAVVVLSAYACTQKKDENKPSFTTPLTFSGQTSTSMDLGWAASDDKTKASDLSYKVVYSTSDNISTETDAEANGTILQDWAINSLSASMTALTPVTKYYAAVMARDEAGNTDISSGSSSTLCAGKIIFLATVANGNLGGAAGADTTCNSQKPTGAGSLTFKALMTDGSTRRACFNTGNDNCGSLGTTGRLNWPLAGSQTYCTSDHTVLIGSTNANGYLTVLTANSLSSTTDPVYTGFNAFWGTSTENCSAFASTASTSQLGTPNGIENGSTQHSFITNGSGACTPAGKIYCVEQ